MAKASKAKETEATGETSEVKATHTVIAEFGDREDFTKKYAIGDDVSHFDADRLNDLVSKGLVEEVK